MSSNCENPCSSALTTTESLASEIDNLRKALLGTFTKTIVNGRAVWISPCSPYDTGLPCNPKGSTEGLICYLLRILTEIGLFYQGAWAVGTTYCKNSFITYLGKAYVSLIDTTGNQPDISPTKWELVVVGAQGNQGAPGASGGGSATSYAVQKATGDVLLTNTSAVVVCEPVAVMVVTIPLSTALDAGKWYQINTSGVANVTVQLNGAETFNTGGNTYVLDTPDQSVLIISSNDGVWQVF